MGCSSSKAHNSLANYEYHIVQKLLESYTEIDIAEFKFTNFKMNYLHYIVYIHNNDLLRSCINLERTHKDILESTDIDGNKIIQTAVICNNKEALDILIRFYNSIETDTTVHELVTKWCNFKGQTSYSIAEQKNNRDLLTILSCERLTNATDMKIDTESNSIPENPKIPRVVDRLSIKRGASKELSDSKRSRKNKKKHYRSSSSDEESKSSELISSMSHRTRQLIQDIENDEDVNTSSNAV